MIKYSNNLKSFNGLLLALAKRNFSNDQNVLKREAVIMCKDRKHIVFYHPEPEHPYDFTKPIERKIENDSILKEEYANLYLKRFDNRPALNPRDHWVDAIRLGNVFNEHPINFRKANREKRIKQFLEKIKPTKPNRQSI